MKQATRAYLFLANKKVTVVSLVVTAVLTIVLWKIEGMVEPSGRGMIGLQLAFTAEEARALLSTWSDGGAGLYLATAWLYYLYAASSAVLLASAPAYFAGQRNGFDPRAVPALDVIFSMVPFAACLSDWAVQSMMLALVTGSHTGDQFIRALAIASIVKWVLLAFCLVVLLRSYFTTRKGKRPARP
jgi:hypothetical protein